jgi:hypothetical protein
VDFATAQTELDLILGDAANTTFSAAEKSRALTKAWNDSYVVIPVWDDSSLTYTTGVYQYALPGTVTALQDIYLSPTGSSRPFPDPISNDYWTLVAGNIQFHQKADYIIPNGYVLYLKGRYKLDPSDTLDTVNLQEYVLALAGANTLTLLAHKKANLFIKNDTTMGELIGLRRELLNDVKELRTRLAKEFESA